MPDKRWLRFVGGMMVLCMTVLPAAAQVHTGSLAIFSQTDLQDFGDHYTSITGYLNIFNATDLTPLHNLTSANGFYISNSSITNLHGLENLVDAGVCFELSSINTLISTEGLSSLQRADVFEFLDLPNLQSISGLDALSSVRDMVLMDCPQLTAITGLPALTALNSLHVQNCPLLADVSGFTQLADCQSIFFLSCPSLENCCTLYKAVRSADSRNFWNSACTAEDILAYGPCEAADLQVAFQFKDQAGNPVGDVLARLIVPGEKDWKQRSAYVFSSGGSEACNLLFKGRVACFDGPWRFKFSAPAGWRFLDPDSLIIEKTGCEACYSTTGHHYLLERIDGSTAPSTPPVEAACPPENTARYALAFLIGTPSWRDEGWCNAVDGDYFGWDGTATVLPDESGYAWAIFKFADDQSNLVKQVALHVINLEQDERSDRWTREFEVLVSTTGLNPEDFASIGKFKMEQPFLNWFNVRNPQEARYVMLKILQPQWTSRNFKQVIEFCVNEAAPIDIPWIPVGPHDQPTADNAGIATLPQQTTLVGSYPNPFNPVTTIAYSLAESGPMQLTICNMAGQVIATLVDETQQAGSYRIQWDGASQPSGVYFCRFHAGGTLKSLRLLLVK
ncbi:MAG TPA: T9SS type A sorting domain-containing protein [bacterium]|nr:T9SS type A sorting domain-containing protein [bacterium]HPR89434.1 T9SS type A sorting domain-containing protein [bacterium]